MVLCSRLSCWLLGLGSGPAAASFFGGRYLFPYIFKGNVIGKITLIPL
jgi:hypothetical protein